MSNITIIFLAAVILGQISSLYSYGKGGDHIRQGSGVRESDFSNNLGRRQENGYGSNSRLDSHHDSLSNGHNSGLKNGHRNIHDSGSNSRNGNNLGNHHHHHSGHDSGIRSSGYSGNQDEYRNRGGHSNSGYGGRDRGTPTY